MKPPDIVASLGTFELDLGGLGVGLVHRAHTIRPAGDHREHPPAGGLPLPSLVPLRPGMIHARSFHVVQARNHVSAV